MFDLQPLTYDSNVLNDGLNQYLYDGEGRICAVEMQVAGLTVMTGYIYDAEGHRVGKGSITTMSCDPTQNGFLTTANYVLGPSGEQLTELDLDANGRMAWQHTNVYAAGNMTNDGYHPYSYDAEGNILTVDSGSNGQFVYDALNHRIRVQTSSSTYEYLFDYAGRRTSSWLNPSSGNPGTGNEGRIYWDGQQIAFRSSDGTTYFDHQDYQGTERMRTSYTGAVASSYFSLPWGDGYSATVHTAGGDTDSLHFGSLDQDNNTAGAPMSEHAQFRNYSFAQGRWLSPDPYDGSYDITNPQSFNRYAYVLNNPLAYVDPDGTTGQDPGSGCGWETGDCTIIYPNGGPGNSGPPAIGSGWQDSQGGFYLLTGYDGGNGVFFYQPGINFFENYGELTNTLPLGYDSYWVFQQSTFSSPVIYGYGSQGGGNAAPSNSPKKGSFPWGWPLNGNMLPLKPGDQDNKCTTGPLEGPMDANPAVLGCCQAHDNCYAAHGCNMTSWIPNDLPWGECNVCNAKAAACITGAVFKTIF